MPMADRVLIRRLVPKTKTAGGVFLPDAKVAKVKEGEVLAVGPGRTPEGGASLIPLTLRVGDKVGIRCETFFNLPPIIMAHIPIVVLVCCYGRLTGGLLL